MRMMDRLFSYHSEHDPVPHGAVFVFGSNQAGRHGAGAAKTALQQYGAIYGQGVGQMGNSYGIPTKTGNLAVLPLNHIEGSVADFVRFAATNYELTFYVTRIGCGLAGYKDAQIAPLFAKALGTLPLPNVILPEAWRQFVER